jgi:hypothetical protein
VRGRSLSDEGCCDRYPNGNLVGGFNGSYRLFGGSLHVEVVSH